MKVERILSETDLLPQRINDASRIARQNRNVLSEDAVTFEGNNKQRREESGTHYPAYGPKKHFTQHSEGEDTEKKNDIDVVG